MSDTDVRILIELGRDVRHELRRMADALEQANRADPLQAIQAALEAEEGAATTAPADMPEYVPPHIARLLGNKQ